MPCPESIRTCVSLQKLMPASIDHRLAPSLHEVADTGRSDNGAEYDRPDSDQELVLIQKRLRSRIGDL